MPTTTNLPKPAINPASGVRLAGPKELFAACIVGCAVGMALGAPAFASWLDNAASATDLAFLHDSAAFIRTLAAQTAVDQPYHWLRHAVRALEQMRVM